MTDVKVGLQMEELWDYLQHIDQYADPWQELNKLLSRTALASAMVANGVTEETRLQTIHARMPTRADLKRGMALSMAATYRRTLSVPLGTRLGVQGVTAVITAEMQADAIEKLTYLKQIYVDI